jgi:hypothetical protein
MVGAGGSRLLELWLALCASPPSGPMGPPMYASRWFPSLRIVFMRLPALGG